jgi:hypothetical protein
MKRETFWLTEIKAESRDVTAIRQDMLALIDAFNYQPPQHGEDTQFKTIVAVCQERCEFHAKRTV